MSATLDTRPQDDVHTLDSALHHLVGSGELTEVQAHRVHEAFVAEATVPAAAPRATHRPAGGWAGRLIEVGAYLGAALVAAGGTLVVGQQWEELGHNGQLAVLAAVTLAFGVAGVTVIAVARGRGGGPSLADDAVLRRLASTLLTLSAAASAGLVIRAYLPDTGDASDARVGWMFLTAGVVAGLVLVAARLTAPSALAEVGLYGAVLAALGGIMMLVGPSDSPTMAIVAFFCVGAGYAAVALLTRLLTVPTLGMVLGLGTALFAAFVGEMTTSRVLLAVLAVGCFAAYLVRPLWPLVTAAMLAAVGFSFMLVGDTFGPAVAMLVSGLLLLVLAAGALLLRRRHVQRKEDGDVLHEVGRDREGVEELVEPEPRR